VKNVVKTRVGTQKCDKRGQCIVITNSPFHIDDVIIQWADINNLCIESSGETICISSSIGKWSEEEVIKKRNAVVQFLMNLLIEIGGDPTMQ